MTVDYSTATETEVREFLRLCLNPGPGRERTPEALAEIIPAPLRANLHRHAPNLGELRVAAEHAAWEAKRTAGAYASALAAWITGDHSAHERDHIDGVPWPQCLDCSTPAHTVDWTTEVVPDPCPQNRRGDAAVPQPHAFAAVFGGPARCLFCALPADDIVPQYRTPDGREWTLAALAMQDGTPLYESPFVGTRYTAAALAHLHGNAEPVHEATPPAYVFNADSVNRTTKHLQDGPHTRCPGQYRASKPIPAEQAAALALCRGCREAATEAAGLPAETP